jgi:multiple sugar transport system substrate-binding protein
MRPFPALVAVVLLAALTGAGCGSGSGSGKGPATLSFFTFKDKSGSFDYAAKSCSKQSKGAYKIKTELLPADADGQREQLVRRLAAKDKSIDLIAMDVIWTSEFAEAKWVRPWPETRRKVVEKNTLAQPLETATYKNKLYAAPYNTNAQILFYRKDLVKSAPKTWAQMIAAAKKIGGKAGKIEVQAAQYEGLTVWFNALLASAGGSILKNSDAVALGQPAVTALTVMKDLASSSAANPSLSNQMEDQNVLAFEEGKAAFMVNYPVFYGQLKKDKPKLISKVGIAPWPQVVPGRQAHSTVGGINLGVSKFSQHANLAFAAAQCMRDNANQKYAAVKGSYAPSIAPLYENKDVKKAQPFAAILKQAVQDAALRPRSAAYNDISLAIQKTISPPKSIDPKSAADDLKTKIKKSLHSGGLL